MRPHLPGHGRLDRGTGSLQSDVTAQPGPTANPIVRPTADLPTPRSPTTLQARRNPCRHEGALEHVAGPAPRPRPGGICTERPSHRPYGRPAAQTAHYPPHQSHPGAGMVSGGRWPEEPPARGVSGPEETRRMSERTLLPAEQLVAKVTWTQGSLSNLHAITTGSDR